MKKIFSLLVVATMLISCFALNAFAAVEVNISLVATKTQDGNIALAVSSDVDLQTFQLAVSYDDSVTYNGNSTVTLGTNASNGATSSTCTEGTGYFTYGVALANPINQGGTPLKENILIFYFTPVSGKTISSSTFDINQSLTTMPWKVSKGISAGMTDGTTKQLGKGTVAYTVDVSALTGGSVTYPTLSNDTFTEGEEVFDGYTATAAATGITVFQKTAEDLAAESYGIQVVTGGKTYKFPGKVAITLGEATEKIWGIKIVAPSGTFSDGTTSFAPTSVKAYVGSTLSDELVK